MKKVMFVVAYVMFVFASVIYSSSLMQPCDRLTVFTIVSTWLLYALFALATFIDMMDDALDPAERDRRNFWKEHRKFQKWHKRRMKEYNRLYR